MSTSVSYTPQNRFLQRLGIPFSGFRSTEDKARLEAFLTAFPGEYCGWTKEGQVIYSRGFCALLGLEKIKTLADIQTRLDPGDAAALENLMQRLRQDHTAFILNAASTGEDRHYKISGSLGRDLNGENPTIVLWIEDITEQTKAQNKYQADEQEKTRQDVLFQSALDTIPRPVWLRDAQNKITWCNATYADFTGSALKQIIADQKEISSVGGVRKKNYGTHEYIHGPKLAAQALASGKPARTSIHTIYNGNRVLLDIHEIPLTGQAQDNAATLGIAYNITKEEDLQATLARYQISNKELLEQLRTAIAIFTADEKLEFFNSAFSQLWGLEDQWLNTRPTLGDIMERLRETRRLPEQADFKRYKESWRNMFTRLIDPHEDMLHLPDGSALRMLTVPHSQGGLMMTFEDVTSRLELESSYNTLIEVQKETLDNLAEAVAVFGGDGRLKLSNPAFGRLWSLHPEDLDGEPHINGLTDKMKPCFPQNNWAKKREEIIALGLDRVMHEGRFELNTGALIDFVTVPLPDGGVLVTYADVTDSVRVENALREKNAALEAAEQLKLDFLANVSYQLRTPLSAIMGFTDILQNEYFGPLNLRQKQYTVDMKEASNRLLELINDILDLSTLEAGYMKLERAPVDLQDMLQGIFDLTEDWARKENLEVRLDCPPGIGTINADRRRLQQALLNLIRNAIAFTPSGGTITLAAKRANGMMEISVIDTGVGISEEDKARIFDPFEKAQHQPGRSGPARGGAGLGLSLVKNIVMLHDGTIRLDSQSGAGTTITLSLPADELPIPGKDPASE